VTQEAIWAFSPHEDVMLHQWDKLWHRWADFSTPNFAQSILQQLSEAMLTFSNLAHSVLLTV